MHHWINDYCANIYSFQDFYEHELVGKEQRVFPFRCNGEYDDVDLKRKQTITHVHNKNTNGRAESPVHYHPKGCILRNSFTIWVYTYIVSVLYKFILCLYQRQTIYDLLMMGLYVI